MRRSKRAMDALRCPDADEPVKHLSGGERRRVALCRLLLQQPDVLLLGRADEPSRRREHRLARAAPATVQGNGDRRHARPLLPRQRGRMDTRTRPGRRRSVERQLQRLARAEVAAAGSGGKAGEQAPQDARARARMGPHGSRRTARQEQGEAVGLRPDAERGHQAEGGKTRNIHPERSASGRPGDRGAGRGHGLRRPVAVRAPELLVAAGRHRRRDRPQRRGQKPRCSD